MKSKIIEKHRSLLVLSNRQIQKNFCLMQLECPEETDSILPGQFLTVVLPSKESLIPRPFSILDAGKSKITIFYKILGKGTQLLSLIKKGEFLKVLFPLGNAFPNVPVNHLVLLSGGIGCVPIFFYMKRLAQSHKTDTCKVKVYLGASDADHFFFLDQMKRWKFDISLSTDNGSLGKKGTCLDALKEDMKQGKKVSAMLACGPYPMLKAVAHFGEDRRIPAYLAMEQVMGCGFGACMGCAVPVKDKKQAYKMVCMDGPVFESKEIQWEPG
ncbi:MAG: dihydroorotate dehydrogenase electron transfer subunit [Candidatus Aureabacteria bacterium]|nr:dihydroorotate dehydrogenase electron transfer subunit [Candidatus Auribacterota bacterium]